MADKRCLDYNCVTPNEFLRESKIETCSLSSFLSPHQSCIMMFCLCVCFRYIIVVEHDLSVLDYLSDFICCLYGVPSAYGVVTMPFSVREGKPKTTQHTSAQRTFSTADDNTLILCPIVGINIFLDGYVPTENLRFRETSLVFKVAETANEEEVKRLRHYQVSSNHLFFYILYVQIPFF